MKNKTKPLNLTNIQWLFKMIEFLKIIEKYTNNKELTVLIINEYIEKL